MKQKTCFIWEIIGCLLCLSLALLLAEALFLEREWEDLILSARFFGTGTVQYQEPIIVKIDEESVRSISAWPWTRSIYAKALNQLDREEPAVIGIDLLFQEPDPENDPLLAETLEEMQVPVVLGTELDLKIVRKFRGWRWNDYGVKSSVFPKADKGYLNLIQDRDGLIRKWPLYLEATKPSFAERLYHLATGKNPPSIHRGLMNFLGDMDSFPSVSFSQLTEGDYAEGFFRGKVVLIGVTGSNMDRHGVAVQALGAVPGVYIQAYLFRNLIEQSWLKYLPNWLFILIMLGLLLCWSALFRNRVGPVLLFMTIGVSIFLIIIGFIFGFMGYILPVVSMIGLLVLESIFLLGWSFWKELKEQQKMKSLFAKYVSPQVLEEILQRRNEFKMEGERRFVAVLFADVRDFMCFAEEQDPELVVTCINQVLGKMTDIILRYGGLVDKFLGDGLLAVFGIPGWEDRLFEQVFAACQEILTAGKSPEGREFAIGIGLAWGIVVAGSVGNQERMEYTIMGAPVNLASRLEKLAGPGELMFPFEPDRVYPLAEGSYTLEQVRIKGMKNPIVVGKVKRSEVRRWEGNYL